MRLPTTRRVTGIRALLSALAHLLAGRGWFKICIEMDPDSPGDYLITEHRR